MAKKLTTEQRRRIAELIGEIQRELAEIRALLEKRLQQRRA